jgi:hypothetical protein
MMVTHQTKKNLAGQITAIEVQTVCDPNIDRHPLHARTQIIQLGDHAANQELNEPLLDVRGKLAACRPQDLNDEFAADLAWLFQLSGDAKLRVYQR